MPKKETSNSELIKSINEIYQNCSLKISDYKIETESSEYHGCQFKLNELNIICRTAKITPKKIGQFVTFWKRNSKGIIEPFEETDSFDFFVVNVHNENQMGQFVFPKSILIKKGIISTVKKEGKRAFRVYPSWDFTVSKQATQTQKWQLDYFYEITSETNMKRVSELYKSL